MCTSEPQIVSVQHFCLHDGPGIRSVIFFKGCPLRCAWCQNPETWSPQPELAFKPHLCIGCGRCVSACGTGALTGPGTRDRRRCRCCFACAGACPSTALSRIGELVSPEVLVKELRPEFPFYARSGGGVTLSGGEPTLHPEFSTELATRLKEQGVHVALETCGHFDFESASPLLSVVDLILFDAKLFDGELHSQWCGADNGLIKRNLRTLAGRATTQARLPLIPDITDQPENLASWNDLLRELGMAPLALIPYHRMGEAKRAWLDW